MSVEIHMKCSTYKGSSRKNYPRLFEDIWYFFCRLLY